MVINGLRLPDSFTRAIQAGKLWRAVGCWHLKADVDAYGCELETELGEVYHDEESLLRNTRSLPGDFQPDGYYGEPDNEYLAEPGFIPDVVDFSRVVCFGMSGDGAPFCFDFREDPERPSVIWWADVYWRRIAPDFEAFLRLLDLDEGGNQPLILSPECRSHSR